MAEIKEKRRKRKQKNAGQTMSELSENSMIMFKRSNNGESKHTEIKAEPIYTYEILLRIILKNADILLMIVLYIAGVNRITIYRMSLLILFALFIIYRRPFRRYFILLLYFIIFMVTMKYLYVIFEEEFKQQEELNNWLKVIGFYADVIDDQIYGRGNLFNSNYAIIFAAFIQYSLYTSKYSKKAFSEEQKKKDFNAFSADFPKLTKILMTSLEILHMFTPWITYAVFFIIAIVNTKTIFN